jgi:hypothetical protein
MTFLEVLYTFIMDMNHLIGLVVVLLALTNNVLSYS